MPKVFDLPTATTMDGTDYLIMEESTGGTKKITKSNVLANIGTIVRGSRTAATIANNTRSAVASISLPAGTWLVNGTFRLDNVTAAMSMQIGFGTSSATIDFSAGGFQQMQIPSGSYYPSLSSQAVFVLNAQTTIYLIGSQSSGASANITTDTQMIAVRIC